MPDRMPEDMPEHMPEDMPGRMPEDMPDRMPEDMPDRMPEGMPDRMPDKMSDRMPEDLPVAKCINVMVGITRSKVILSYFSHIMPIKMAIDMRENPTQHPLPASVSYRSAGVIDLSIKEMSISCVYVCMHRYVYMYACMYCMYCMCCMYCMYCM